LGWALDLALASLPIAAARRAVVAGRKPIGLAPANCQLPTAQQVVGQLPTANWPATANWWSAIANCQLKDAASGSAAFLRLCSSPSPELLANTVVTLTETDDGAGTRHRIDCKE